MTDLQKFDATTILDMARSIAGELDDSTASLDQLVSSLEALKFRDPSASYWTVGPRSLQWYRYVQSQWHPAGQPAGTLEGLEILYGWVVAGGRREPPAQRERQKPQASSAPAFLQVMVQETRQAYDQGLISSTSAEASLTNFFLLDRGGRFWTPGIRTGSWYFFADGRWNQAQQPPAPETLLDLQHTVSQNCANCGMELGEGDKFCRNCGIPVTPRGETNDDQIGQAVAEFLSQGMDTPPEAVTDPWDPPAGFPEIIRKCPVCETPDVGDHTHCRVCRSPLALPTTPSRLSLEAATPPGSIRTAPIYSPGSGPARQAHPAPVAPPGATARQRRSFPWLWVAAGGCVLLFLCSACALVPLWAAYTQGYLGF